MQFKVKVGCMSRTIEWIRVDAVPAAAPRNTTGPVTH